MGIHLDLSVKDTDEAEFLMLHHLSLAATYFEAVGSDMKKILDIAEHKMSDEAFGATEAFLTQINKTYEDSA